MKFSSLLATIAGATTMLLLTPGATAQKVASNPSESSSTSSTYSRISSRIFILRVLVLISVSIILGDACNSKWHCSVGNYCAWYTDGNSAGGVTEGSK